MPVLQAVSISTNVAMAQAHRAGGTDAALLSVELGMQASRGLSLHPAQYPGVIRLHQIELCYRRYR